MLGISTDLLMIRNHFLMTYIVHSHIGPPQIENHFGFSTNLILLSFLFPLLFFRYEKARRLRVAIIHGMARMAALMASTYKAYLGVGLGPLSVGQFVSCCSNNN